MASWPLAGTGCPDLAVVDCLARLQLAACRAGVRVELREPCPDLVRLLDLVGLLVEVCGEPEELEQPRVQEAVLPDDPVPG